MSISKQSPVEPTNREQVKALLAEKPTGYSKSKLKEIIGGNAGAFRRLMSSMESKGEIVFIEILEPECGLTRYARLPENADA